MLDVQDETEPGSEPELPHGVGPWPGGEAEWPDDPRLDPDLLAAGDRRNVVDRYRYWRMDAIVADLDERRHPFHVAIENWGHDFNIGSVVRTANAFLAREVQHHHRKPVAGQRTHTHTIKAPFCFCFYRTGFFFSCAGKVIKL